MATLTFGIAATNAVKMSTTAVDNEYARFVGTGSNKGLEGRTATEMKSDMVLSNVENTKLSTWAGSTAVTKLGTIATGTWNATAIADGKIASASNWNAAHGWGNHASAGYQAALSFGITAGKVATIHTTCKDNEYARFTNVGFESVTKATLKSDLSLNNVDNTKLSTWVGTSNITTLGNITAGSWNGTAIADGKIASSSNWNAAHGWGNHASAGYVTSSGVTSVATSAGLNGSITSTGTISLALSELTDMTQTWVNNTDEFIVLDNGVQKRKKSSEIFGSNAFTSGSFLALGTTSSTAHRGDHGVTAYNHSQTSHVSVGTTSSTAHRGDHGATAYTHSQTSHVSIGTTSSTAHRGDHGATAYTHSQAAHAPSNATYNPSYNNSNWDTAYGWGAHSSAGYVIKASGGNSTYVPNYNGSGKFINSAIRSSTTQVGIGKAVSTSYTLAVHAGSTTSNCIHARGTIKSDGDIIAYLSSDKRLKKNITPISDSINKLSQIRGVTFEWKKKSGHSGCDYGVIAQEVEKVLPLAVTERDDTGHKAVRYEKLIPLLIEAVKDLSSEVEQLKKQLKNK